MQMDGTMKILCFCFRMFNTDSTVSAPHFYQSKFVCSSTWKLRHITRLSIMQSCDLQHQLWSSSSQFCCMLT